MSFKSPLYLEFTLEKLFLRKRDKQFIIICSLPGQTVATREVIEVSQCLGSASKLFYTANVNRKKKKRKPFSSAVSVMCDVCTASTSGV